MRDICRLLHVLITVRGYKTVVRFFPHEAADLERVLQVSRQACQSMVKADLAVMCSTILAYCCVGDVLRPSYGGLPLYPRTCDVAHGLLQFDIEMHASSSNTISQLSGSGLCPSAW